MAEPAPVIAIDGPGGSGKGTIAQRVARRCGWHLLDSGALYRVVALAAAARGVTAGETEALARIARGLQVEFRSGRPGEPVRVWLEGRDVTRALRAEACGEDASRVAAVPAVRAALLGRQRGFRRAPGLVADGRDMGTVVFPDAQLKIYLTASLGERARRRYKQLIEKGIDANLPTLSVEIAARDRRDRERAAAPLRPAEDAVVIDTTGRGIDEILAEVLELAAARGIHSG